MRKRTRRDGAWLAPISGILLLVFLVLTLHPRWRTPSPVPSPGAPAPAGADLPVQDSSVPLPFSSAPNYLDAGLQAIVDDAVSGMDGEWAVAVKKLDTGQYAAVNAESQTVTASLYKVFVLYEVMRQRRAGQLSLDEVLPITAANAGYDISIGELHWNIGDQVTIATLLDRMITVSDNTAAITLVYRVGPDNINASLRRLGLNDSAINFDGGDNLTTAADYTRLLEMIATGQVLDRASCQYMINLLLGQQINNWLPMGIPGPVPVAHKTGTLDDLTHDAGIVYGPSGPYIITVMSWNHEDITVPNWLIPQLSRDVYQYFNGRSFQPARYFPETQQVIGPAFLLYYNTHGGVATFGLPLTAETQEGDRLVQYFERARMERAAAGGDVTLGRIGSELTAAQGRQFPPTGKADPNDANTLWFPETQQAIGQPFLTYWREHGGQEIFGLPISNIVVEQHDGEALRVQYFERARFELHDDSIQLGSIGSELLAQRR